MRQIVATAIGILVVVLSLNVIRLTAAQFGIVPELPLSSPVERSYGRHFSELVDSSDTLFGMASFFMAAYLGLTAGYAVHRAKLLPWRTRYERATALAWAAFLAFTLAYSAAMQVIFGAYTSSSGIRNLLIDLVTHGVPAIFGWRLWRWWKRTAGTSLK